MKKKVMIFLLFALSCLPVFADIIKTEIDDAGNVETSLKIARENYAFAFVFNEACLIPAKSLLVTEYLIFGKADFSDVLDCSYLGGKYINSEITKNKAVYVKEPGNYQNFSLSAEKGCVKSGFFRFRSTNNFFIDIFKSQVSSGVVVSDIHNRENNNFYDFLLIKNQPVIRPYLNIFFVIGGWKIYAGLMMNFSLIAAADILMLSEVIYKSKHADINLKMCWWSEYFADLCGECGLPLVSWNTAVNFNITKAVLGISSKGTIFRHNDYQEENDCFFNRIGLKMIFRENDYLNVRCSLEIEKPFLSKPVIAADSEISAEKSFNIVNVFWKYRYSENYYQINTSAQTGVDFKNGSRFSIEIGVPHNLAIKTDFELGNFSFSSDIIICRDNLSFSLSVSFQNQMTESI